MLCRVRTFVAGWITCLSPAHDAPFRACVTLKSQAAGQEVDRLGRRWGNQQLVQAPTLENQMENTKQHVMETRLFHGEH